MSGICGAIYIKNDIDEDVEGIFIYSLNFTQCRPIDGESLYIYSRD